MQKYNKSLLPKLALYITVGKLTRDYQLKLLPRQRESIFLATAKTHICKSTVRTFEYFDSLLIPHTMRTRFLATDYSTAAVTAVGTLDFLHLPLPHLPPPNCSSFSENFLRSFDEIPFFRLSREIEKLPIDDALSIFLSDVRPHFIDATGFEQPKIDSNDGRYEVILFGRRRSNLFLLI